MKIRLNYRVVNNLDLVRLAKEVQTRVYWGEKFYLNPEEDMIPYKQFWDIIGDAMENGLVEVEIEGQYVKLIYGAN